MTAAATKERPIIFSGEMVRAILDRRKTQTRRVVKWKMWPGMPVESVEAHHSPFTDSPANECSWTADHVQGGGVYVEQDIRCPYGLIGDRLWVRETWAPWGGGFGPSVAYRAGWKGPGYLPESSDQPATREQEVWLERWENRRGGFSTYARDGKWSSPYHMPRWASRITLEITDVRVPRVQEISRDDAIAEGVFAAEEAKEMAVRQGIADGSKAVGPLDYFRELWESLNAKRGYSWESDPWVWALTFKRLEDNDA